MTEPKIWHTPMLDCEACGTEDGTMTIRLGTRNVISMCLNCWQLIAQDLLDNAELAEPDDD